MTILKKKTRNILIIILSLIAIVMLVLAAFEIFMPDFEIIKKSIFEAEGKSDITYKVHMKENPIYGKTTLPQEQYYVKPFIDHIEVNCDFVINSKDSAIIEATNRIDGVLISQIDGDEETEVVWEKTKNYAKPVLEKIEGNELAVNRSTNVYLEEFDTLVNKLIEEHNLLTDYVLQINFITDVKIEYQGEIKAEEFTSFITIPFTDAIFNIEGLDAVDKTVSIDEEISSEQGIEIGKLILYFVIFVVVTGILILILSKTKVLVKDDEYMADVLNIFKEYGDRLAGLSETLAYQSSVMISIDKFEDVVKIADEIGQTVFYYRVEDENERKVEFYVFDEGRIYYLVKFGTL